jgi:hypothetical protein
MVHGRAGRQLGVQVVEGRGGAPGARGVPGLRRQVTQRQDPPTARMGKPRGAVRGQEVEEDGVARPQVEPPDIEAMGVGVDVGQFGQAALGEPAGLLMSLSGSAIRQTRYLVAAGR